jgi:hypothetical protein
MFAPSLAKAIATARPIPLSPPVMSAILFCNLPLPRCFSSSALGRVSFYPRGQAAGLDVAAVEAFFSWACEKKIAFQLMLRCLNQHFHRKWLHHRTMRRLKKL